MAKPKKYDRKISTLNLETKLLDWFAKQPRSFSASDWLNRLALKEITKQEEAEKKALLAELKAEIASKQATIAVIEQDEAAKRLDLELKARADAQYAAEQQEVKELQSTLDYWRKQGDAHKNFLAKLEWEKKATLPEGRLPRLRALKAELDRACAEGEGRALLEKMKEKL